MHDFVKLSWIEAAKMGSYLVATTPSASINSKEQLRKYYTTNLINTELSDKIFGDYSGTAGLYAHELYKLKLLLSAIHAKAASEEETIKDFVYALRNMLMHSDYKAAIKYIEKPSTSPATAEAFLHYVEAFDVHTTAYTKTKYLFVYSFIKNIIETNKFMTKTPLIIKDTPEGNTEFEQYFTFVAQNNAICQLVQQHMDTPPQTDPLSAEDIVTYFSQLLGPDNTLPVPLENDAILAVVLLDYLQVYKADTGRLYFKKKYTKLEQAFEAFGVHLQEVLQQHELTRTDLTYLLDQTQPLEPKKRLKQVVTHIAELAFAQYLQQTTMQLNRLLSQESTQKMTVQKTPKSANPDAALKKELFDAKNMVKQLEAEQAKLKKELRELQQKNTGLALKVEHAQKQNDNLQQQLTQASSQQALSPNAKELVYELAFLVDELKLEVGIAPEEVITEVTDNEADELDTAPASENYLEKVQHLKIAVVGGHAKYHAQLKNAFLQDLFTVSPNKLNTDVSKLLNYDVIILITSYSTHSLYERSFDFVKRHQAKDRCIILNTQPNAKRLAKTVYEFSEAKGN